MIHLAKKLKGLKFGYSGTKLRENKADKKIPLYSRRKGIKKITISPVRLTILDFYEYCQELTI
jgi:hypothetical protein